MIAIYRKIRNPLLEIYAASLDGEIVKISLAGEDALTGWLNRKGMKAEKGLDKTLDILELQLELYSKRKLKYIDVPHRLLVSDFDRKVLEIVKQIPYGNTLTYKEVAEKAGVPQAYRAIGQALRRNPLPLIIPCHRVVKSDHTLGGFTGGVHIKKQLLELESLG